MADGHGSGGLSDHPTRQLSPAALRQVWLVAHGVPRGKQVLVPRAYASWGP